MKILLLLALFPVLAAASPTFDLFCKCGTITSYEVDSIVKITFDSSNMIITGQAATVPLSDIGKIIFDYQPGKTESSRPQKAFLAGIYPNPFNPVVTVDLNLSSKGPLKVVVFNCMGQQVKTLFSGNPVRGHYRLCWDGRSDQGRTVAGGVFIVRLEYDGQALSRKIIYAK